MSALATDLMQARKFLAALVPDGQQTFQTFDDRKDSKHPELARVFQGSLEQHAGTLTDLNKQGAGVYIMVNAGDGAGRRSGRAGVLSHQSIKGADGPRLQRV